MPIAYADIDGQTCPVIVCDACGERIEDCSGGKATAAWFYEKERLGEEQEVRAYFAHNPKCFLQLEASQPGTWLTENLDVCLAHLLHNANYDAEKAEAAARLFRSIGP